MNRRKAGNSGVLLADLQRRVAVSGLDEDLTIEGILAGRWEH